MNNKLRRIRFVSHSVLNLVHKRTPHSSNMDVLGRVVALFGWIAGSMLFTYKYYVGRALDSPVIIAGFVS
jgi:hypothetical protein